ncbi:Putative stomatin/prohibitin-family membrane protease subunit YbbK [hydrothermal vent metagenome]|uniref:Putative stomatin/prohibitin-family membrane protease subunit YbbK n=1 Tax=hydrothermal vent metagenome TaxID=652676 RepID=A0A1W1EK28_9ZZZZ
MEENLMNMQVISFAVIIAIGIIIIKGIVIVPQAHAYVIERLGKYNTTLEGGFHIIIPILDSISAKLTKQEQMIDIPSQSVITKDNVNISVDGLIFVQVENAKLATYGIVDFKNALANLSTTTLRAEIGQLALDETLSSRDTLNRKILSAIDEASSKWGVKTMRVELRDISVPLEIEEAMNLQMKAEREKRAIELTAMADKEAVIREAEGAKAKAILEAEAIERMADASKYQQEKVAEGQQNAMLMINSAMANNPQAAEFLLAKDRVSAFNELAKNPTKDKIIVPYETTELIGSLSILKEFIATNEKKV